jgi:hypothetical protein
MNDQQVWLTAFSLILWAAMQMIPTEEHHDPLHRGAKGRSGRYRRR